MADNQKYYYLKLKENFFDTDEMMILESMPDGYLYSNILLKLYLRSLKYDGRLMFNARIPFNSAMLATVTRHSVGVVEKAMQVFQELELVEVLDNGAIYISDIQNFIGKSSTEADRIREYRKQIDAEKSGVQMLYKCTPEIEIEKEIDTEIEKERDKKKKTPVARKRATPPKESFGEYGWVKLSEEEHSRLIQEYGLSEVQRAIAYIDESAQSTGNKNRWKDWNLVVRKCIRDGWGKQKQQQQQGGSFKDVFGDW